MQEADYVIVGAGPAGCALAARLAASDARPEVVLIEAGRPRPSLLSTVPAGIAALVPFRNPWNYAYETVPQARLGWRRGYVPRGRGVGGSSLINAMIFTRGHPEDYDGWAAAGCAGWGWADVLPLFRRLESNTRWADAFHGADGPLPVSDVVCPSPVALSFIDAATGCGYPANDDFNGPVQEGVGLYQVYQRNGRRVDAGTAYLGDAARWPNLTVLSRATALRVTLDGRRATGVEVRERAGTRTIRARREVILSAGSIATPQILMHSGIGPGEELRRLGLPVALDAPGVGRNLQDHIDYAAHVRMRGPGLIGYGPGTALRALAAIPAFRRGQGMLTTNATEAGGFLRSAAGVARPDLQLHLSTAIVDDHARRVHVETGVTLHVCVLRPESRGTVTLTSPDPRVPPRIDPQFLTAEADRELLRKGAWIAHRILAAEPLARYGGRFLYGGPDPSEGELDDLIRDHSDTIYHPVGTCRMGADSGAVLDPALRMRGMDGLRVADASVMPTLVSGNTQAPSAMIGEKAADLILGRPAV